MEDVMKHEMVPYFDENTKANDWVKNIMRRVRWSLFRHQGAWVYMAGERGKRRNPMTRHNAYDYICQTINEEMRELTHYLTMELLREYHNDDIDFDCETAQDYNNYFELSEGDEGYAPGLEWDEDSSYCHQYLSLGL